MNPQTGAGGRIVGQADEGGTVLPVAVQPLTSVFEDGGLEISGELEGVLLEPRHRGDDAHRAAAQRALTLYVGRAVRRSFEPQGGRAPRAGTTGDDF